jgi:hypothetical protein
MQTFVSLDTQSGIIRRYSGSAKPTHEAALTNDPEDASCTLRLLQDFRVQPHWKFSLFADGTYESALAQQRRERQHAEEVRDLSHRDEA